MYREGHSVSQSDSEAVRWFQFAVNHASGEGCLNLSQMYFKGRGVTKDESKALAILQKGAMLGHSLSQTELARRLAVGDGAPVDPVEACAWYELSVRGGGTDAKPARDAAFRTLSAAQVSSARARASSLSAQIETEKAERRRVP
jgi:TPR repeat protein